MFQRTLTWGVEGMKSLFQKAFSTPTKPSQEKQEEPPAAIRTQSLQTQSQDQPAGYSVRTADSQSQASSTTASPRDSSFSSPPPRSPGLQRSLATTTRKVVDDSEEDDEAVTNDLPSPDTPNTPGSTESGASDQFVEHFRPQVTKSFVDRLNECVDEDFSRNGEVENDGGSDDDSTVLASDSQAATVVPERSPSRSPIAAPRRTQPTITKANLRPLDQLAKNSDYKAGLVLSRFQQSSRAKMRSLASEPTKIDEGENLYYRLPHRVLHSVYENVVRVDINSAKIIMGFAYSSSNTIALQDHAAYKKYQDILKDPGHAQIEEARNWWMKMQATAFADLIFMCEYYETQDIVSMVEQALHDYPEWADQLVYVPEYTRADGKTVAAHTRAKPIKRPTKA